MRNYKSVVSEIQEKLLENLEKIKEKIQKIDCRRYISRIKNIVSKTAAKAAWICGKIRELEFKNRLIRLPAFLLGYFKLSALCCRKKTVRRLNMTKKAAGIYFYAEKQKIKIPAIIAAFFYFIAIVFTFISGEMFYLFNFMYIGTAAGIGIFLSTAMKKEHLHFARKITQLLIGSYILIFLGLLNKENIQIEGFLFSLSAGIFSGAVIHFMIAKIIGPFLFGRGWCGWACWSAMVFDILPFGFSGNKRIAGLEYLRYAVLSISALVVFLACIISQGGSEYLQSSTALSWLVVGNIAYYCAGFALAFKFKDNRAFCKYLCPVAAIMKQTARFSAMKMEIDAEKCDLCGLCEENCMMGIELLAFKEKGKRVLSTECVLCGSCADNCPNNAIKMTCRFELPKHVDACENNRRYMRKERET